MGAGRKPKPVSEKQRHSVAASLTDAEYRELAKAAGREPLGAYVHRLILRHLARRRR